MDTYYHITIQADWNDGDFVYTCLNVNEQEKDYIVKAYLTSKKFIKEYSERYPSRWYRQAYLEDVYNFADNLLQFDDELDAYKFTEAVKEEEWVSDLFTPEEVSNFVYFYEDYIPHGYDCPSHTLHDLNIYEFAKHEHYE
jgi:hypothetical protein